MLSNGITNYFRMMEDEGWTYTQYGKQAEPIWWLARCRTSRRRITVYVGQTQECILWQLPLTLRVLSACRTALYRYLLRLNHDLRLAKFCIDGDERLHLTAETTLSNCTFTTFKDVMTAMRTYFEQYHREIELLASSSLLAAAWLSLIPEHDEPEIKVLR